MSERSMSGCQPRPKWVLCSKNPALRFFLGKYLQIQGGDFASPNLLNSCMNKEQLNDIQKSLNWIRSQAEEADAASKVEVLALLNATSQSVIQMAKKLIEPKTKTKVVTQFKDKPMKQKPRVVKQGTPPETATDLSATPFQATQPQPPISPLSNQQPPE